MPRYIPLALPLKDYDHLARSRIARAAQKDAQHALDLPDYDLNARINGDTVYLEVPASVLRGLVQCASEVGWSLHAPGASDEAIASGDEPYLWTGPGAPGCGDYCFALVALIRRRAFEKARERRSR